MISNRPYDADEVPEHDAWLARMECDRATD